MSLICKVGNTKPLIDIVNIFLLYTYQQDSEKYIPNYLKMAQDVYSDLQFNILRSEIKKIYPIDKKLGTVKLPADLLYWQQISGVDDKGNLVPLLENNNMLLPYEEVVVKKSCPNPKCQTDICADVRSITAEQETVVIGGIEYTNITQTQLQPDGSVIKEVCRWYALGYEISDYSVTTIPVNIIYSIGTIKIDDVDLDVNQNTTDDIAEIQATLNALGKGVFTVTSQGGFITIISLENKFEIQSVYIPASFGPPQTIAFTKTNTNTAVNRCMGPEQICKLELTEDLCVADTPDNTTKVKACCKLPCCEHIVTPPTVSELDGILYFSNNNYEKVLITYKTSGINFAQTLMVPDIAETAMISGLKYYSIKHKRAADWEKESARKIYNIDKNKLIDKLYPKRVQEFIKASRVTEVIF